MVADHESKVKLIRIRTPLKEHTALQRKTPGRANCSNPPRAKLSYNVGLVNTGLDHWQPRQRKRTAPRSSVGLTYIHPRQSQHTHSHCYALQCTHPKGSHPRLEFQVLLYLLTSGVHKSIGHILGPLSFRFAYN